MTPPAPRKRHTTAALPDLTPAQQQTVRDAEENLGRISCPETVSTGLQRLGLAAEVGPERSSYLTLAGWTVRDQLAGVVGDTPPTRSTGPFTAATGEGILAGRDEHAATARRAWQSTLELRRLTSSAMTVPAPLELQRPVHYVALALEAGGVAPSDVDAGGRCQHTGYLASALDRAPTAARVEWKRASTGLSVKEGLAECRRVLQRRGWRAEQYLGVGRRPYLVVWPAGSKEPLL